MKKPRYGKNKSKRIIKLRNNLTTKVQRHMSHTGVCFILESIRRGYYMMTLEQQRIAIAEWMGWHVKKYRYFERD